jgi:hypothetical protein
MKRQNGQHASTVRPSDPAEIALERHYSPQEVAEMWGVSVNTIRRAFRGEPGVIEFGSDETMWGRKRKTMRIPVSALIRVHELRRSK